MTYIALMNTPSGMKSISLESWSPEAFRNVIGQAFGDTKDIAVYYETVPWFRRGIDVIVGAMEALPVALMRDDEEIDPAQVGIETDLKELLAKWALWFMLFGATYATQDANRVGTRRELNPYHPSTITPIVDYTNGLTGFTRTLGGVSAPLKVEDVIYVWEYNASAEDGPGRSRAAAALAAAGLLSSVDAFSTALFRNGAISPMLIEVPTGTPQADKERIRSWAERTLTGVRNAFRPQVVEGGDALTGVGGFKSIQLASPPKDLSMPELTQAKREDISTALGVPQAILFSNATSGTSSQQDKLNLYDETVIPLFYRFARPLNEQVFKPLGVEMIEQHGKLEIYQRQETAKAYGLAQLWTTNAITREYLHDMLELPEMYKQGTYYADIAKPANAGGGASEGRMLAKPPDLPDVPTIEAPEPDDMMKADLARWQRLAVSRIREGKPEKALKFESDSIPAVLAGAIRGKLKNTSAPEAVAGIFDEALVWGVYP